MRIRGERECRDCGTRWSYYETASVNCPDCGSVRSRGLDDERALHTDGAATLDLSGVREDVDARPLEEVAAAAKATCRSFVRRDGFVRGGELLALSDTHLAARELVHAADLLDRARTPAGDAERYLLALLAGADTGDRPEASAVPEGLWPARGLAAAEGVRAYRGELLDWLADNPHPELRRPLGRLDQHGKRVEALQGEIDPATAELLVETARALTRAARSDDGAALAAATDRLDRLDGLRAP